MYYIYNIIYYAYMQTYIRSYLVPVRGFEKQLQVVHKLGCHELLECPLIE